MPKIRRLRREDFPARFDTRLAGTFFSITASKNPLGKAQFGCVVSKKIAPRAVDRNRIKRRCRAIFLELLKPEALTIVVYPKRASMHASFDQLKSEAEDLLGKLTSR